MMTILKVSFAPSSADVLTGQLTITSNDPDEPVVTVDLLGQGLVPPEIVVTPDSLYVDLLPDQSETRIVTIANNGGSDLDWSISVVNASVTGTLLRTAAAQAVAGITCSARVEVDGILHPALTPEELGLFQDRLAEFGEIGKQIATVERDAGGDLRLAFDGSFVRFVPSTTRADEGVVGVTLETRDADAVLAAARRRGLPTDAASCTLCGTRFELEAAIA